VRPRTDLDAVEKTNISCPCRESNSNSSPVHPVVSHYIYMYIYIYLFIYLTAIGLLPGGSVYKRTYIQQGNSTYISRNHTVQHKYNDISKYNEHKQVQ
jgi:hypothetical protein